jgi:DNA-binding transcriptional MerR regulator
MARRGAGEMSAPVRSPADAGEAGQRTETTRRAKPVKKSPSAFRTISEVSGELDVPQHVLRFWETKFSQIRPMKRGGGRRYYRPEDITLLRGIRELLYADGYTIKGVQKLLRESGVKVLSERAAGPFPAPVETVSGGMEGALRVGRQQGRRASLLAVVAELEDLQKLLKDAL